MENVIEGQIKDCPFCGGKADIHLNVEDNFYFVECASCLASSPIVYNSKDDAKLNAIYQWNIRAADQQVKKEAIGFAQWLLDSQWIFSGKPIGKLYNLYIQHKQQ